MAPKRMLVATDVRLRRGPEGTIVSTHPAVTQETFAPLAEVYDAVTVLARRAPPGLPGVTIPQGAGLRLALGPDFTSPLSLLASFPRSLWLVWTETGRHDVVMGRLPEPLSLMAGWTAVLRRRPFIANLVAAPGSHRLGLGRLSGLVDRALLAATRGLVRRSAATIYVTESYLQRVYPPPRRPSLVRSNVRIDEAWFLPARESAIPSPPRIVLVGSNQSWDKGQLVLLDAAGLLAREGRVVHLTFVGGGRHIEDLGVEAHRRRLPGEVTVLGQVEDREGLAAVLDEHDVFCLPSLSEGLPRAMIEALARGLPCVGTSVGGIPELLPHDALCAPGDAVALAGALRAVLDDPDPRGRSAAGLETARRVARRAQPSNLVEFLRRV